MTGLGKELAMNRYESENIDRLRKHLGDCTVLLKKNGNLPAQIRMNLLSKEFSKSEDLRYFDDFKKWMQDEYGKYGYEVEVNLSM